MTLPSHPKSGAWPLFLAGVGSVPIWTLVFGGRNSTVASHTIVPVLMFVSLLACVVAPFLAGLPPGRKIGLALLGLCAFLVSLALSVALSFAVHGLPIG